MFLKNKTMKSTNAYWVDIRRLKQVFQQTKNVVIGAGAGLSMAAGFQYGGKIFQDNFADFAKKYGLRDMYTAGFYPYETLAEYWAYWSRHIMINRYQGEVGSPYSELLSMVKDKDYFVLTTNVDHCFQRSGFDKNRLFYTQGDYGLWQCSKACCQETYDNEEQVRRMVAQQSDMKIPTKLIPYCPHCGSPLTMNLRIDQTFVQDKGWYQASNRYDEFLKKHEKHHILYLELGVGNNTPGIIKYPFWNQTLHNQNAVYACVNEEAANCPANIKNRSICIQADIQTVIHDLSAV